MRIGRHLTVQEVYNQIINYNSNYELSEAQIEAIYSNICGAVGILSRLLGINSTKVPILSLTKGAQVIPNNSHTAISWDTELIDNISSWRAVSPTQINTPHDGIFDIYIVIVWDASEVGLRQLYVTSDTFPFTHVIERSPPDANLYQNYSGTVSLKADTAIEVKVNQTSGGNLTLLGSYLILRRKAFLDYLG